MDNENLQTFLDESEIVLNGVRGGILMFAQNTAERSALEIPFRRVRTLSQSAAALDQKDIEGQSILLSELIVFAAKHNGDLPGEYIRNILDQISGIEALLAGIRMSQEDFTVGLSELVDSSFETLSPREETAAETPEFAEPDQSVDDDDNFEVDAELLEVFAEEAEDLLKNIETNLARLVSTPDDKEALWEIRRNAHTFKGSAGIVGLKRPSEMAHRVEDLLDRLVETEQDSHEGIIPLLFTATECLRSLAAGENTSTLSATISTLYQDIDKVIEEIENPQPKEALVQAAAATTAAQPASAAATEPETEKPRKAAETRSIVRVSLDKLDDLVNIIRDLVVSRSVFEQKLSEFDHQIDDLHNATRRLQSTNSRLEVDFEAALLETDRGTGTNLSVPGTTRDSLLDPSVEQFDSLEFDRYTEFHQAIRELSETSSDTFAINTSLEALKEDLGSLFDQQRRLIDAVQEKVMRIRLVAFGTLKTRLDRSVRVTCDEEGKKAEIFVENEQLEVDTQILDSLIEPLLHLLKNAVVHGIESPEMRRLLGKSETGRIGVKLTSEETHVVLTVSDDGGGIATGSLKDKAVTAGIISPQIAETMSDDDANELIFLPGLTTAQKLNLNAGRGVGMNIIKESVESHKGTISLSSVPHRGTTFTVRLPLPLAVTTALLVRSGMNTFAVPFKLVNHVIELSPDEITWRQGSAFCKTGKEEIALRHIEELAEMEGRVQKNASITAFVVDSPDGQCAIAVDSVIRSEEIVIKPLGRPLDKINGLLGASILGNGQLVTILDLPYLLARSPKPKQIEEPPKERSAELSIMVVDDSPSVRLMTSKVIKGAGWNVVTAKDGVDALEILRASNELPAVILSDIEMPRMGGFELVGSLKEDDTLKNIPVIVISSRAGDKHRDKAFDAGVAEYLVKPYSEWELIQKIKRLSDENAE
ncbi:MAG: response regulator [Acidobacteria bacterium]|nr:response regulator [Acidobacteriota bacterium]